MQTLDGGQYAEDFFYGYPYEQAVPQRPPQFDYSGESLTSAGVVVCDPGRFELHYASGVDNPDVATPYGGAQPSHPGYMRFPVMSWGENKGIFFTVITYAESVLSFDRSFSGFVKDRLVVTVNDMERISITGSAGYSWTRDSIVLGRGIYRIAVMLSTPAFTTPGVIREGVALPNKNATELRRYLRLTNLTVTNLALLPTANDTAMSITANSELTALPGLAVTSGRVLSTGQSALLFPTKISGVFDLWNETSVTLVEPSLGQTLAATLAAQALVTINATTMAHTVSYTGGFAVGSSAVLQVHTPPQDLTQVIRPLRRAAVRMTTPVIIGGKPHTLTALCENEVATSLKDGFVLDKIDPYSVKNTFPATIGATATYRWLSIDAQRDPNSYELTEWHAKGNYNAPFWATGGSYRPTVDYFSMKVGNQIHKLRYPSVQFDSGHLDHLNVTLGNTHPEGVQTWVMVGSFARFRGDVNDSLPLIDFAPDAEVNYQPIHEATAVRGQFMPWMDSPASRSMYLGLTSYAAAEPTTSRIAWRADDEKRTFNRSDLIVVSDFTPMVFVFVLDGANSRAYATPLVSTGNGSIQMMPIPRGAVDPTRKSFTLGRSRVQPPFGGNFLTGSMSLLEVSYFNRALTDTQARSLTSFLAGLYAPVTTANVSADFTKGNVEPSAEQFLIYAGNPETPLALCTGDRAVVFDIFPSSSDGQIEMERWNSQGVPTVECTNRDYSSIIARLEAE